MGRCFPSVPLEFYPLGLLSGPCSRVRLHAARAQALQTEIQRGMPPCDRRQERERPSRKNHRSVCAVCSSGRHRYYILRSDAPYGEHHGRAL